MVGTGVNGRVEVEKELEKTLPSRGIALIAAPNAEAIERFNELVTAKRVGACFHLTC